MDDNVKQFLNELTLLTQKYNIAIYGCGCCPVLFNVGGKIISEKLEYKNGTYEIEALDNEE